MTSEAAQSVLSNIRSIVQQEELADDEATAVEQLKTLLVNCDDLTSDVMKQMRPLLGKIDQEKRARHGLGWDL